MLRPVLVLGIGILAVMLFGSALSIPRLAATTEQGGALERADLIVVLGGGHGARTRRGAQLYAAGRGTRVLVTGVYPEDPRGRQLQRAGVPLEAILLDGNARNTWQEARLLRDLMQAHGWRRVLVISDPPHLPRVRWSLEQAFEGSDLEYALEASRPAWWEAEDWWREPVALRFVAHEALKGAYYRLRYGNAFVRDLLD